MSINVAQIVIPTGDAEAIAATVKTYAARWVDAAFSAGDSSTDADVQLADDRGVRRLLITPAVEGVTAVLECEQPWTDPALATWLSAAFPRVSVLWLELAGGRYAWFVARLEAGAVVDLTAAPPLDDRRVLDVLPQSLRARLRLPAAGAPEPAETSTPMALPPDAEAEAWTALADAGVPRALRLLAPPDAIPALDGASAAPLGLRLELSASGVTETYVPLLRLTAEAGALAVDDPDPTAASDAASPPTRQDTSRLVSGTRAGDSATTARDPERRPIRLDLSAQKASAREQIIEFRVLSGVIADDAVVQRLLDLEEAFARRLVHATTWDDAREWLPELRFDYVTPDAPELRERLDALKRRRLGGYWELLADPPRVTAPEFARAAIAWLRTTFPHVTIETDPAEPFGFAWDRGDGVRLKSFFDNIYRKYRLEPDAFDGLLTTHFDPIFAEHTGAEIAPTALGLDPGSDALERLRLRIFSEALARDNAKHLLVRPLIPGLVVALGIDSGHGSYRMLAPDDIAGLGLDVSAAFARALENLGDTAETLREAFVVEYDDDSGGLWARGRFAEGPAAVRILHPEFAEVARRLVGEAFVVGIPMRDLILLIPRDVAPLYERLRRDVAFLADVGPYAITGDLLVVDELGIERFVDSPVAGAPAPT